MTKEEKPSSKKISNLDIQAIDIGRGGKFSPETDESTYKKRMQKRKDVQSKRLQERNSKKGCLVSALPCRIIYFQRISLTQLLLNVSYNTHFDTFIRFDRSSHVRNFFFVFCFSFGSNEFLNFI